MSTTKFGVRSWWQGGLAGLLLAALVGLAPAAVSAQTTGQVRGTVKNSSGAPVSDVQVYLTGPTLAGGNVGSISRLTGIYVITSVPAGSYEMKAEKIGMSTFTKQITVTAGGVVTEDITLTEAALGLDEIVVTGTAGAARRREVGNQVATINTADLPERPTSVMAMLQAQAPGMEVTTAGGGGEIGEGLSIALRGTNQIGNGSSSPVIFIDGVRIFSANLPLTSPPDLSTNSSNTRPSPLGQINPNDIERIEVISGPAASTLYGTEAAGGVIQIFTKKGTSRAPVWTAESQVGTLWSQRFGASPEICKEYQPDDVLGCTYINMGPWICPSPFDCGRFMSDWHGLGFPTTQYNALGVRGGGQALQYYISGSSTRDHGSTPKDAQNILNVRGNFTLSPLQDVMLNWNTAYTHNTIDNTSSGNNAGGLVLNVFRQEQGYFGTADADTINTAITQWDITQSIERLTTGATVNYTPLERLTNRLTIGYDMTQQETRNIRHVGFRLFPQGGVDNNTYTRRYLSFDYVGTYSFNLLDNLTSSFSWGGQATGDFTATISAFGEGFPGTKLPTVNSAASTLGFETRQTTWNSGFFFQDLLSFMDRYFVTLGLRVDGNSTFGKNFGLQFYPKASGSWVISDENFWPERFGEMKLRAAYGVSGRAPNSLIARRTWNNQALAGQPAFLPGNRGNPDIGPEVTNEYELGFDASWFNDRVRPRVTHYHQNTKDAIQSVSGIPSLGFTSSVSYNLGETENWGNEVALDVTALRRSQFGLDIGFTWSKIGNRLLMTGGATTSANIGRPIGGGATWTMYHNTEGMGNVRRTEGTYTHQSCDITLVNAETNDTTIVPRPGIDPSVHACSFSSVNIYGRPISGRPSVLMGGNVTLRLPAGINVSARGEYKGGRGYWRSVNAMGSATGRNVRSPVCLPYYANTSGVILRTDTPNIWTNRCTAAIAGSYNIKGELFNLRSISASMPMDWAFPDRVSSADLTIVMNNVLHLSHSMWGMYQTGSERMPESTSLRASLRVSF